MTYIIYLIVGISTGIYSGLLGLGGGIVVVPSLLLVFRNLHLFPEDSNMHIAVATSLASMVFTASASSLAYNKRRLIIWPIFWNILPGLITGAVSGVLIAKNISSDMLANNFGIVLILIAIHIFFHHKPSPVTEQFELNLYRRITIILLAVTVGLVAGFFGIGGGILIIPALIYFGISIRQASGTAAICGFPGSLLGSLMFMLSSPPEQVPGLIGFVYWPAAIIIAISSMIFAPVGVKLASSFPQKVLRRIFSVTLIGVGLNLVDPLFKLVKHNLL